MEITKLTALNKSSLRPWQTSVGLASDNAYIL